MKKRRLGLHGPEVSALGLGCLSFGGIFGPTTEAESLRTLDAAWDAGMNFLDTANIYGKGVSETVIGRWLASRRHRPVIATKAAFTEDPTRRIQKADLMRLVTKGLNRNERLIIILYYYEELTMKEIGATLDLSESRVSQMHSAIVERLQNQLERRRPEFAM